MNYWSMLFLLISSAAAAAGVADLGGTSTGTVWMLCAVSLVLLVMSTLLKQQTAHVR